MGIAFISVALVDDYFPDDSFRTTADIDSLMLDSPGMYAIRLAVGAPLLPEPFQAGLEARGTRVIYIGVATKTLRKRLKNELRGTGAGTFFRSLGAILGFRPIPGSLVNKANKYNFTFGDDRGQIVEWISAHLEVSWRTDVKAADIERTEALLIGATVPLLNLDNCGNKYFEPLKTLRTECRAIARGERSFDVMPLMDPARPS